MRPDAVATNIRWSTEEPGEGTTLEIQRERCSLFSRSQGWVMPRGEVAIWPDVILRPVAIRLIESAGQDREAVQRVIRTWAILLADQAQRKVAQEIRASTQKGSGAQ